uniref:sperm acrosome associated 6 isoform X1 n=1 Tax=Doryrhamphus excisus TaxID=161450 RepID=UPI0025ADE72A|nr:sperm acrosome associated 6 isoform X1 [Doryrhamphus excisus]XP_057941661.1 sperm acrosome associated 6 isoform X1 [Doryrhamphus excisus]XP_057941663.1 sperm acrosome associated 6 isoform X1 [Doryrhamphus excisus]
MAFLFALSSLCFTLVFQPSLGCFDCFITVEESTSMCLGYMMTEHNLINLDNCFATLKRLFTDNPQVIEAGRVGKGSDSQLKKIMQAQIQPLLKEFKNKKTYDTVYEEKLQTAADNFIAAASKLPRVTGCIPPCGFQMQGEVYDCISCMYDSCSFQLDCPVERITAAENTPTQMWCNVQFPLPSSTEIIWRFAEQVETQDIDKFEQITVGEDKLYSIPSTRMHHQGTYQCEIYSKKSSIVRLYYYITVTPHVVEGHSELQEIFELSLLPGGRLHMESVAPQPLPSIVLIAICFTSLLLLLILSLGTLFLLSKAERTNGNERTSGIEDLG